MGQEIKKMKRIFLAAAMAGVLVLTGCGGNAKREDKELKIGFLGSRQAVSESAPELLWGMETAKEDLNRKYQEQGYTVTVEFFDDRGEKGGAAEQAKEILAREDIDFVFVLSQDEALEKAAKRLARGGRTTFWLDEAGQAARGKKDQYQFYNTYSLAAQAEAAADYLRGSGVRRIAAAYTPGGVSKQEYEALCAAAEQSGIEISAVAELDRQTPDEAVKSLRDADVQAVAVLAGSTNKNVDLIRAVRKQMPDVTVFSDHTVDQTSVLKSDAKTLEGTIIPCDIQTQWDGAELNALIERYQAVYKEDSQVGRVSHGYFSLAAAVDAAVACGTAEPKTLDQYFKSPSSARYLFDENGALRYDDIPMLQARNGVFEIVGQGAGE